jgi:hypothetical protein
MAAILQRQTAGNHRNQRGIADRLFFLTWETPHRARVFLLLLLLATGGGPPLRVHAQQLHCWTWASSADQDSGPPAGAGVCETRKGDLRALPTAMVHLQHQSMRLGRNGRPRLDMAEGLGTVVRQHTILTHGHYRRFRDPTYVHEAIIVTLQGASTSASVDMRWLAVPYADAGTTLLVLPDWMRLPEAVALGDPEQLRPGDAVSVVHWDDARSQFAILETTLSGVRDGVARIIDPEYALGPGDSGGAVYNARGELIGNVWSIGMSGTGQRLPWSEVALLPAGVGQYVR